MRSSTFAVKSDGRSRSSAPSIGAPAGHMQGRDTCGHRGDVPAGAAGDHYPSRAMALLDR
jgi:hypothetical protein